MVHIYHGVNESSEGFSRPQPRWDLSGSSSHSDEMKTPLNSTFMEGRNNNPFQVVALPSSQKPPRRVDCIKTGSSDLEVLLYQVGSLCCVGGNDDIPAPSFEESITTNPVGQTNG